MKDPRFRIGDRVYHYRRPGLPGTIGVVWEHRYRVVWDHVTRYAHLADFEEDELRFVSPLLLLAEQAE